MNTILLTKPDHARIKKIIHTSLGNRSVSQKDADSLLKELNLAKVVEPYEIPSDVVTMNSIVKLKFVYNNNEVEIQIVYPKDADSSKNKISIFSPIATALIGYKVGDEVEWVVPAGITKMKIVEIIYQPELAGEFEL